jgi:hypothetical protein
VTHTSVSPNSGARVRPTTVDCRPEMRRGHPQSARPTTVDLLTETHRAAPQTEPEPRQLQCFEEMFQAYHKKFLWTAGAILRNKEDVEDAVQNALISGLRNLRNFEGAPQHRSATDCERPVELARFPCPSQPKPPRLQTLRRGRIVRCFSQLLYNPKCIGISRHIEMQDLPPVVAVWKKRK